jgi:lysophospholipase L1-like esterase
MQRMNTNKRWLGPGLFVAAIAVTAILVVGLGPALVGHGSSPASTATPAAAVSTDPAAAATLQPTASASDPATPVPPSPTPASTATAAPISKSPALPTMLAAIGDSYSQAWSVSTAYKRDHPQFSWVVGTAKKDGVFSLRERFEALGDPVKVYDAATSGVKMSDALRQAQGVVGAAQGLPAGSTVYVTFELGINDLCDQPMTTAANLDAQLRAALEVLRAGLPHGSRILVLPVPDFARFSTITAGNSAARALFARRAYSSTCAPFLGTRGTVSLPAAKAMLSAYDSSLSGVCSWIEANDGPSDKLHCRTAMGSLADSDWTIADLSTVDYFHPSLAGQARLADAAWKAGDWSAVALPAGAKY